MKSEVYEEEVSTRSQKGALLLAYILYLVLGAVILQTLEKDLQVQQCQLAVKTKIAFLKNRSNITQEDVELFAQTMTSLILSGIPPLGNKTSVSFWMFRNSFMTSLIIVTTIGYGTMFPRTAGGQMFCVLFAAIGIPLTIIFIKHIGKLISLPFESLGNHLKYKGINEKSVYLWKKLVFIVIGFLFFLVSPPFVFMPLENWTYIEGIYYSFSTIAAIGFGDYTIISNSMKENKNIIYSTLLLIWNLHGLAWIALLFNLITNFFQEMESKLHKDTSGIEAGEGKRYQGLGSNI